MSMNSVYDTVKYLSLYIDSTDIIKCMYVKIDIESTVMKKRDAVAVEKKDTVNSSHATLPHHYRLLLVYNSMGIVSEF